MANKSEEASLLLTDTSAEDLFQFWDQLQATSPRADPDWEKRALALRSEIERRIDKDDPDVYRLAAERLSRAYEKQLLPTPVGLPLTEKEGQKLSDGALQRKWRDVRSQLDFHSANYPDLSRVSDWLLRGTLMHRKLMYERALCALATEMMRRGLTPNEKAFSPEKQAAPSVPRSKRQPEIAQRRTLVKRNPGLSASGLCAVFDAAKVPLPNRDWPFKTWVQAFKDPKYRSRIQTIISKDRSAQS